MSYKKNFSVILILFSVFSVFSQNSEIEINESSVEQKQSTDDLLNEDLQNETLQQTENQKNKSYFLTIGPMLMINTDDATKSAPNPVMYSLGFGCDFFQDKVVNAEARLSFFTNYYLWDGENAQPAEIENRTATGLSFMIDALGGHSWNFGDNQISLHGGLGILARFALLSSGVDEEKSDDVSSINSWFYSNMNFIYPEIAVSYLRSMPSLWKNTKVGGEFRTYFSMGGIMGGDSFDGMIFSFAAKIQF